MHCHEWVVHCTRVEYEVEPEQTFENFYNITTALKGYIRSIIVRREFIYQLCKENVACHKKNKFTVITRYVFFLFDMHISHIFKTDKYKISLKVKINIFQYTYKNYNNIYRKKNYRKLYDTFKNNLITDNLRFYINIDFIY